ncbi:unnamed protein product [Notodromas monacha]|uniref:Nuclear transcription factor Y subunit gamma n=1 Tax=Notodromas monacha TaxID=399045 RepID=A0A7R9G9E9_9CRUS|nr:unnamed protein product [Notodromas monacha]CAG0912562.1 unnamed protein product [Notodromas monacha]
MSQEPQKRRGHPTAAQVELDNFWPKVLEDIKKLTPQFTAPFSTTQNDYRAQADLPLARIKKIMKLDEDVKMISAEAPVVFAKAAEIFIHELTLRAWIQAEEGKRRTLQRSDIAQAIAKCDQFDFLIDIVPREEPKPPKTETKSSAGQEQILYNLPVTDGAVLTQQAMQGAQLQLVQIPGTSGLTAASMNQQQQMQTIQILGANGQIQTVALLGGGAMGIPGPEQNGEQPRTVQIPAGFSVLNQGSAPQIQFQLQQPTAQRPSESTSPQPSGQQVQQNIQFLQQIVGPNGEIQTIPISLNASQLSGLRTQLSNQPSAVVTPASALMAQGHQVDPCFTGTILAKQFVLFNSDASVFVELNFCAPVVANASMDKGILFRFAKNLAVFVNPSSNFHRTATVAFGGHWRRARGQCQTRNRYGPLADLPDWSYIDGRPGPLTNGQRSRLEKQKAMADEIYKSVFAIDSATAEVEELRKVGKKGKPSRLREKGFVPS